MNKTTGAIAAVIVIIAVGGAFALMHSSKAGDTSSTSNSSYGTPAAKKKPAASTNSTTAQTNTPASDSTASTGTITYGSSGFSPATLTLKTGSKLTVKNDSSNALQFNSNPHPQHTDDPELNIGLIGAGQSKTVTVTKTGSHGYHNHLDPTDIGMLIVD